MMQFVAVTELAGQSSDLSYVKKYREERKNSQLCLQRPKSFYEHHGLSVLVVLPSFVHNDVLVLSAE